LIKGTSGCNKSTRTQHNIDLVKELIDNDATKGIRKLAAEASLNRESV
jgi:hypothetical protein